MIKNQIYEILAPAGNPEKLRVALSYGADAVYLGGYLFGLRSAAGNFSIKDIEKSISYAHKRNKKVYMTLNTFPKNEELKEIEEYLKIIKNIELDALIIADPGVFSLAREITNIPIHISTQSSVTNHKSVSLWKNQGVKRIILARELSIKEAKYIREKVDIELEMFIHGSMCMSYSGKCTISNYTVFRDANRGGCVNSCRWDYTLYKDQGIELEKENPISSYIMNSKDLQAILQIPEMIEAGVSSFKIEGRMKSFLYVASTISVYRDVIDTYLEKGYLPLDKQKKWFNQINSIPNRSFTTGFLENRAKKESVLYDNKKPKDIVKYIGIVLKTLKDKILVDVKNTILKGDEVKLLGFDGKVYFLKIKTIQGIDGEYLDKINANNIAFLNKDFSIFQNQVICLEKVL